MVTATASEATDTEVGRVVPVWVTVADADGTVLATLEERFAIRGRTGAAELTDPARAGGAVSDNATDTPRRRRRDVTITAPIDMRPFAVVSGDHNPIHTDRAAALLAGLKSPIVHGMWLSAAAQHVVTATDGEGRPPARLIGWTARFLGMVEPGDEVDFRVDRVGIDQGAEVLEVAARIGSELVMSATARLAAPKTVYAFPGQGIQHKGMGMEVRARSKAARKVWDTADKFTRETLGFSVLHVVRDNPTSLIASGVHYQHPEGVLYLTQFTQVAMATVAAAQVAEMREQGAFVEGAIACGHSVGEYTALACVSGCVRTGGAAGGGVPPRQRRCTTSCRATSRVAPTTGWPRSGRRRSTSTMPTSSGFVAEIAERTGEFLQIVNFNLRGSQYAIAGTVRGLEALEEEVERRREISGGKRSFILVPGIDVPFHSSVLRVGVADFRRSLERVMPRDKDPELIVGRYIPNLVPRPFTLDRDFIQEIRDLVPAEPLDEVLADYDTWRNERPEELCRKIVIELLAWQFASPVRWIETQDLLFIEEAAGGLGVERFVEIGVKSAPTVAGLATNTLKLPEYAHSTVEVLNSERDAAVLFATDTDPEPEESGARLPRRRPPIRREPLRRRSLRRSGSADRADGCAAPGRHRVRRRRRHPGADRAVGQDAHRPDRAAGLHRVDHRRRVVAAQPAAGGPGLRAEPGRHRRRRRGRPGRAQGPGHQAGPHLQAVTARCCPTRSTTSCARCSARPASVPAYIAERVKKTWELGDGWAKHVTVEVALGTREGSSVRGGASAGCTTARWPTSARVDKAIDCRGGRGGSAQGRRGLTAVGRGGGAADRRRGRAGRVRRAGHRARRRAGDRGPAGAEPAGTG